MPRVPNIGEIVLCELASGFVRPAIVVHKWGAESTTVQLQVFVDGTNDQRIHDADGNLVEAISLGEAQRGTAWRTSVAHASASEYFPRWHWSDEYQPGGQQ